MENAPQTIISVANPRSHLRQVLHELRHCGIESAFFVGRCRLRLELEQMRDAEIADFEYGLGQLRDIPI